MKYIERVVSYTAKNSCDAKEFSSQGYDGKIVKTDPARSRRERRAWRIATPPTKNVNKMNARDTTDDVS